MDIHMVPAGHIRVTQWNVVKMQTLGTYHIAGYENAARTWRVSTALVEFDSKAMTAKTRSGSRYTFTEPRGDMHALVLEVLNSSAGGYSIATENELGELNSPIESN